MRRTGDEEGLVRVWDLTTVLRVSGAQPMPPIKDLDPHRKDFVDGKPMTELTQRRAAQEPELQAVIQDPLVASLLSWRAHADSVQAIQVLQDPPRVLTAGYDHLAILWDFEGVRINVLAQSQTQVWNVGIFPGQTSSDEARVRDVYAAVSRAANLFGGQLW